MLETIFMVTLLCFQCDLTEKAFVEELDYRVVERGVVTDAMAENWGALDSAGKSYRVLQPASGEPVYIRYVQSDRAKGYRPMKQLGWNATEILVQDPEKLANSFDKTSGFKVLAPPAFLSEKKNTLAFQATGPNNELLYFTRIYDNKKSYFDLGYAQSKVDRVFIMVVGSHDLEKTAQFYRDVLKLPVTDPIPYRIGVLSKAYGLAEDTKHNLALAPLPSRFMIEIDQYPSAAAILETGTNHLPAGVAMVSFEVKQISEFQSLAINNKVSVHNEFPYDGRMSITLKGPSGERYELIESEKTDDSQSLR